MRWDLIAEVQLYGFEFGYTVGLTWSLVTHQPDHIQRLVTPGGVQLLLAYYENGNGGVRSVCHQALRPFVKQIISGHRVTLEG